MRPHRPRRRLVDALLDAAADDMSGAGPDVARAELDEAGALLEHALPAQPDDGLRNGRLELMWSFLLSQSDVAAATAKIERAAQLLKPFPNSPEYASALIGTAHFRMPQRRFDNAQQALAEALHVLPPSDPQVLEVQQMTCDLLLATGQRDKAEGACRAAFETSVKLYGDSDTTIEGCARLLASAVIRFGRTDEARVVLEQRVALLRKAHGAVERRDLGATYVTLASVEIMSGRPAQAREALRNLAELHLDEGKREGMQVRTLPELTQGELALAQGRFDDALAAAQAGMLTGKAHGADLSGYGDGIRAVIVRAQIGRGDLAAAQTALESYDKTPPATQGESHPASELRLDGLLMRVELALAQKQWLDAMARASAIRHLVDSQPGAPLFAPVALAAELLAGRAELGQGHAAEAARHFDQATTLAQRFGKDNLFLAQALEGQARFRQAAGDTAAARSLAAKAEAIARAQGASWPLPGL
jgi:tetratricopeptide (TPR) repeat protein